MIRSIRFLSAGVALVAAAGAHAVDAYSNLGSGSALYQGDIDAAYFVSPTQVPFLGFQFVPTASGTLAGFRLAINDIGNARPFSLSLYEDSGTGTLGKSLGTYGGTSTGRVFFDTTSALATVTATGPRLTQGTKYWLGLSTSSFDNQVAWNYSLATSGTRDLDGRYSTGPLGAFSVQVNPVPEPASWAALGVGAAGLTRRRKKASARR